MLESGAPQKGLSMEIDKQQWFVCQRFGYEKIYRTGWFLYVFTINYRGFLQMKIIQFCEWLRLLIGQTQALLPLAVAHAIGNIGPHGCPLLGSPCTVWEGLHYNRYINTARGSTSREHLCWTSTSKQLCMVCFPNTDLNKLDVGCSALVGTGDQLTGSLLALEAAPDKRKRETSAGRQLCLSRNCAYSTIAIPTGMMMIINSWI